VGEVLYRWPRRWFFRRDGWWQRGEHVDGRAVVETVQDDRELILERAAALRRERVLRDLSFGRQVASIPIEDYYKALAERPALRSGDRVERERAWAEFLSSPEARKFLVTDAAPGRF